MLADTGLAGLMSADGVHRLLCDLPILANKIVADKIMASTRLDLVHVEWRERDHPE